MKKLARLCVYTLALFIIVALGLSACQRAAPPAAPAPPPPAAPASPPATPAPPPPATPAPPPATPAASPPPTMPMATPAPAMPMMPVPPADMMAEGKAVYAKSCAVCHGANGEGTAMGPKVAGHSATGLKVQVRNPVGKMPAFPVAQLSNADLDKVAAFIASLGPAAAPVLAWEKAATETMHHWMALLAIKTNDTPDAIHHLQMVLTYIKEPKHKAETEKALELLKKGNLHDGEHEIEEMAGAESPAGVSMQRFHLTLAMRRLEEKNAALTKHHLENFMLKASPADKATAQKAVELMNKGDFHEAEHEIEELMSMMSR